MEIINLPVHFESEASMNEEISSFVAVIAADQADLTIVCTRLLSNGR